MPGRGGAGNYEAFQSTTSRLKADIEAQHLSSDPPTTQSHEQPPPSTSQLERETATTTASRPAQQQYSYSGRGGAGNVYAPADLASKGTFAHTNLPPSTNTTESTHQFSNSTSEGNPFGTYTSSAGTHTPSYTDQAKGPEKPRGKVGRGGAGNMLWGDSSVEVEEKRKEQERERQRAEEVERRARELVDGGEGGEGGLQRPEGAWLGEFVGR